MAFPTSPPLLCVVKGLSAQKGTKQLFQNLSFQVKAGQCLQIIGANGSGKTTLLRLLAGLEFPLSGKVVMADPFEKDPLSTQMCFIGHQLAIKSHLTVEENITRFAALGGLSNPHAFSDVATQLGLGDKRTIYGKDLSQGQQKRLSLAPLFLQKVPLWILDEPFVTLDKAGVSWLSSQLLQQLSQKGGVIITSHQPFSLPGDPIEQLDLAQYETLDESA